MQLQGQCVILTGASGGIGSALCAALLEAGASVLAVGRNAQRLQPLRAGAAADRVIPVVADLSTANGRSALVAAAEAASTPPSVLVLAHAQSGFGLFEQQHAEQLEEVLHANLVAPALLVHALLPLLRRRPQAAVVGIGSTFGSIGFAGFAGYSASKFGLRGLFEALAREHADTSVRFQYLAPRATRTAFNTQAVDALNHALGTHCDAPDLVAAQLVRAIERGDLRRQLGWPEKLFVRLNGAVPSLVDRSLRGQLSIIRRHATAAAPHSSTRLP
ncbi:SDR family oxidoreductase [Xanthomonas maliensis]|uniref:SDR family oxidoreductase n=1 Tax=Xanthomonas maliensis TaxID=1321368 RepID=UPI0003A7381B|nr:SDR family oxidoreductase [Xanthomonas maliensis]KAB7767062.1 short chain dehydrogenase [Xanthomonas maliensis]